MLFCLQKQFLFAYLWCCIKNNTNNLVRSEHQNSGFRVFQQPHCAQRPSPKESLSKTRNINMNISGNWKQHIVLDVCAQEQLMCLQVPLKDNFQGVFAGTEIHNFFFCLFSKAGGGSHLATGEVWHACLHAVAKT